MGGIGGIVGGGGGGREGEEPVLLCCLYPTGQDPAWSRRRVVRRVIGRRSDTSTTDTVGLDRAGTVDHSVRGCFPFGGTLVLGTGLFCDRCVGGCGGLLMRTPNGWTSMPPVPPPPPIPPPTHTPTHRHTHTHTTLTPGRPRLVVAAPCCSCPVRLACRTGILF